MSESLSTILRGDVSLIELVKNGLTFDDVADTIKTFPSVKTHWLETAAKSLPKRNSK